MTRTLLLSAVLVTLAGCAATGTPFIPEKNTGADTAMVYVYRPSASINCCVAPYILINNEKRGQLKNGGYLALAVPAGPTLIEAVNEQVGFKSLKLSFDGQGGQSYYVRWSAAAAVGWATNEKIKPQDALFQTEEAKRRSAEAGAKQREPAQRAIDNQTANGGPVFLTFQHEREFRTVGAAEAGPEIALTRKSD